MYAAQTFDGLPALFANQLLAAYDQTGVITDCYASLTTNSSQIDTDVAAGDVQIAGTPTTVSAQTVTLADNPADWPRRDVIWIDDTATAQYRQGDPEPYEPLRDTDQDGQNEEQARATYRPAPDDMSDVLRAEPPTGVVIATVTIPPQTGAADALGVGDLTDRRIEVPSTAGAGSHDSLTDVSSADHHTRPSAGANLQENSNAFDVVDAASGGTIDADSVDGYDLYVQNTVPSTSDPYIRLEDE
ncbi:hypothetical protein [Halomarina rubra]|uniref:Uncharacterized protein n=1 Tax=Halomarina rubra TaxID=2071873 RepID=A0ABD6B0F6_9EURY|nr:hypothetical protein [Halomarina rubra]